MEHNNSLLERKLSLKIYKIKIECQTLGKHVNITKGILSWQRGGAFPNSLNNGKPQRNVSDIANF